MDLVEFICDPQISFKQLWKIEIFSIWCHVSIILVKNESWLCMRFISQTQTNKILMSMYIPINLDSIIKMPKLGIQISGEEYQMSMVPSHMAADDQIKIYTDAPRTCMARVATQDGKRILSWSNKCYAISPAQAEATSSNSGLQFGIQRLIAKGYFLHWWSVADHNSQRL